MKKYLSILMGCLMMESNDGWSMKNPSDSEGERENTGMTSKGKTIHPMHSQRISLKKRGHQRCDSNMFTALSQEVRPTVYPGKKKPIELPKTFCPIASSTAEDSQESFSSSYKKEIIIKGPNRKAIVTVCQTAATDLSPSPILSASPGFEPLSFGTPFNFSHSGYSAQSTSFFLHPPVTPSRDPLKTEEDSSAPPAKEF